MFLLIILTKSNQIHIIKAKRILCKLDFEIDRMYKPIIIQSGLSVIKNVWMFYRLKSKHSDICHIKMCRRIKI